MAIEFRPSTPEDLPGIIELMQAAFEARFDAPFLDPDLLRWKYFEGHPNGGSHVLVRDGKVVSHGCAWPVSMPGAVCLIDWVSAKGSPGMGIMLARKIGTLSSITLSIGGSDVTQQIMPKIGFEKKGGILSYARVLRPWRQFRTRPGPRNLRAVVKLVRNVAWSCAPSPRRVVGSPRPPYKTKPSCVVRS